MTRRATEAFCQMKGCGKRIRTGRTYCASCARIRAAIRAARARQLLARPPKGACKCDAAVVPCTVLDCFGGAGTTGLVADRLQRNAVLIELSPAYVAMAARRIRDDAPLFAAEASI